MEAVGEQGNHLGDNSHQGVSHGAVSCGKHFSCDVEVLRGYWAGEAGDLVCLDIVGEQKHELERDVGCGDRVVAEVDASFPSASLVLPDGG